jgi:hypothetical protein
VVAFSPNVEGGTAMTRSLAIAGIATAALLLACGGADDGTAVKTPDTAAEAPTAADVATPETPDVAAIPEDAMKQCLSLAAQRKWDDALAPCTQAAKDHPTDLSIKHALQQAQAAAEG